MNARTFTGSCVVHDMPLDEYIAVDALSAGGLRLLARSAWHYHHRVESTATRPMLRGSLAHCAALEPHAMSARYVVVPEDAPRRPTAAQWAAKKPSPPSVEAMTWWSAFNADCVGREIVSAEDYAITEQQLRALAADPAISEILSTGQGEVSVFWTDAATGVPCKARPDWVHETGIRRVKLLDLKSTADESPSGFGRIAARMKYHLQQAHYVAGWEATTGQKVDEFVFAAVTSAAPVLAVPYLLTDEIRAQAEDERRELLELYALCRREDSWPSYGSGYQLLDFPAYAKRSSEVEVNWSEES